VQPQQPVPLLRRWVLRIRLGALLLVSDGLRLLRLLRRRFVRRHRGLLGVPAGLLHHAVSRGSDLLADPAGRNVPPSRRAAFTRMRAPDAPIGVAERDRAAAHVHAIARTPREPAARRRDPDEGFVDLVKLDVFLAEPRARERHLHRADRRRREVLDDRTRACRCFRATPRLIAAATAARGRGTSTPRSLRSLRGPARREYCGPSIAERTWLKCSRRRQGDGERTYTAR
jgi:hypothetical protein